jgi:hypothetical protein
MLQSEIKHQSFVIDSIIPLMEFTPDGSLIDGNIQKGKITHSNNEELPALYLYFGNLGS